MDRQNSILIIMKNKLITSSLAAAVLLGGPAAAQTWQEPLAYSQGNSCGLAKEGMVVTAGRVFSVGSRQEQGLVVATETKATLTIHNQGSGTPVSRIDFQPNPNDNYYHMGIALRGTVGVVTIGTHLGPFGSEAFVANWDLNGNLVGTPLMLPGSALVSGATFAFAAEIVMQSPTIGFGCAHVTGATPHTVVFRLNFLPTGPVLDTSPTLWPPVGSFMGGVRGVANTTPGAPMLPGGWSPLYMMPVPGQIAVNATHIYLGANNATTNNGQLSRWTIGGLAATPVNSVAIGAPGSATDIRELALGTTAVYVVGTTLTGGGPLSWLGAAHGIGAAFPALTWSWGIGVPPQGQPSDIEVANVGGIPHIYICGHETTGADNVRHFTLPALGAGVTPAGGNWNFGTWPVDIDLGMAGAIGTQQFVTGMVASFSSPVHNVEGRDQSGGPLFGPSLVPLLPGANLSGGSAIRFWPAGNAIFTNGNGMHPSGDYVEVARFQ